LPAQRQAEPFKILVREIGQNIEVDVVLDQNGRKLSRL
jgi:hypothetical protein